MFTGLIQDVGTLRDVIENQEGRIFEIETQLASEVKIGDSVGINGCCLTAISVADEIAKFQAVGVTLAKTSLGSLVKGSKVNLELALRLSDRLGGHLVQGHVNCIARFVDCNSNGENYHLWFEVPTNQLKYVIKEGSIALSGISLTIAEIHENRIMVTIIPHTWINTNLKYIKVGDSVNVEVDMMAKYLENFSKYQDKGL